MTLVVHQAHRVYTKEHWADEWTLQPHVYCDRCTFAVSPDMPEAELTYNFGRVMRVDSTTHDTSGPKNLLDYYVKIEIDQAAPVSTKKWYGIIVEDASQRDGALNDRALQNGANKFYARGLEYLLQRTMVDHSFVTGSAGGDERIERGIGFNLGAGDESCSRFVPNMGGNGDISGRVFAHTLDDAEAWTQNDILNYLVAYHAPRDKGGTDRLGWEVDTDASALLGGASVTLRTQKNLKAVLDELIDRRRMIAWYVDVVSFLGNEHPVICVFSLNRNNFTLPDGTVIPGNENTKVWDLDFDLTVGSPVVIKSATAKHHRVKARGERMGACFTINEATDTVTRSWNVTHVDAYNAGATGWDDYASLDDYGKTDANQRARAVDKLIRVYRYFRVPPDWIGAISGEYVCPVPDSDPKEPTKFWCHGLRFLPRLPLKTDHNYTTVTTEEDIPDATTTGSKPEYLRPFALLRDGTSSLDYKYSYLDRISRGKLNSQMEAGGREWSASLRMQDDEFGIVIDVQGAPQHVIAKDEFAAADTVDAQDYAAEVRWQNIFCTVFAEFDQYVEAHWPESVVANPDVLKDLIVEVPNARLDYLTPGTIVGVDDEGDPIESTGGYVRDDRGRLKNIARAAYEWYSQERNAISVVQRNLTTGFALGQIILAIGASAAAPGAITVNSCVTSLDFDLVRGTVGVRTQFAELDLGAF